MLSSVGFVVDEAESGEAGLEIYREQADQIDAVLIDLTMPGMDGVETFRRLAEFDPSVRVVLMSGFKESFARETGDIAGVAAFLQKSFGLRELVNALSPPGESE